MYDFLDDNVGGLSMKESKSTKAGRKEKEGHDKEQTRKYTKMNLSEKKNRCSTSILSLGLLLFFIASS